MLSATIKNADVVAWVCLILGVLVLLAGGVIGLVISLKKAPADAKAAVQAAQVKIDETKSHLEQATVPGLEAGQAAGSVQAAAGAADAAKSALDQVAGIVGSLPEPLRFAGLLVLVGTVLISVATIQFGGVKLF